MLIYFPENRRFSGEHVDTAMSDSEKIQILHMWKCFLDYKYDINPTF